MVGCDAGEGQSVPASGEGDVSSLSGHAGRHTLRSIGQNWRVTGRSIARTMCEPESVEYLRDLIQEKDHLDALEGHHIIKSLLNQGEIICN